MNICNFASLAIVTSFCLLGSNENSWAQTLSQTTAYILSGGFVELGDMKEIDRDTIQVPGYMVLLTYAMMPVVFKIANRERCEVIGEFNNNESAFNQIKVYFNNVIIRQTRQQRISPDLSNFYLVGEDYIACVTGKDGNNQCVREYDTTAKTDKIPRVYDALKYLYSNFCTSAQRKGAF